jgi:N-acetylglucosaminyldiphosphoundecaprenol N-acetyl-beta-D-mannosaminyltransferase
MRPQRVAVLGVPVDCVDEARALARVTSWLDEGRSAAILAVNPEKVIKATEEPELLAVLSAADLLLPDGIGVVWAARTLHQVQIDRVPGADFMQAICRQAAVRGDGIFLYGASGEVNAGARRVLEERYVGIRVVGNRDGYVPESQMPALIEDINASGAKVLFVALGSPRQERWIASYLPQLPGVVCQGVGGTFDVITGAVQRAPATWQTLNLEWAYRLVREPRRIRRQLALPKFAWRVIAQKAARIGP